jgi:O-antigen/teichoic acid export membrane protein
MSLTKKAGVVTISRAVTITAQLLATIILTRSLPKEDFSLISFLLLVYATVQTFGQLGLPDSVFYFFEKLPKENRKSITLLIGKLLLYFALTGTAVLFLIGWLGASKEGFHEARMLLWVFMLLLIFELPTILLPNVLIALDKAKNAAWLNVIVGISQFLAITLPVLFNQPVAVIAYGLLAYGFGRMLFSAAIFFRQFKGERSVPLPKGIIRELFSYSVPLSIAQIFWSINRQIDKYVVQWFLPVTVFAEYTVGAWEIPIIPTIAYSVASVMMPQLVNYHLKGEKEKLLSLWFSSIRKVSVIVLPLVMVFIVTADEFIVMLFSEEYINAALPFRIYSLILLQRVASYSSMQKAIGSTKYITYAAIYVFMINGVLCIPLVLWLGVAGPPLASVAANTFTWWYSLSKIQKALKVTFREVFPIAQYLKTLAVAALPALPLFLLKNQLDMAVSLKFTLTVVLYLAGYLLLARLTRVIGQEDWDRMLRAVKLRP